MKSIFIGIDLAIAKQKHLPVCFCSWEDQRLVPILGRQLTHKPPRGRGNLAVLDEDTVSEYVNEVVEYISASAKELQCRIERIGIDAPSAARSNNQSRRKAEVAMDKAGISCFTTPSEEEFERIFDKVRLHIAQGGAESRLPHANQLWMYVGFQLFEQLSKIAPCIEVFPQATVRAIGAGAVHKSKAGAAESQLLQAAKYTGWPSGDLGDVPFESIGYASAHDRLDAYLSAWVAALPETERIPMGEKPDDVIWIPKVDGAMFQAPTRLKPVTKARPKRAATPATANFEKVCPACGTHTFKRWPFGWDAHAAHKCSGLESSGESNRKAEYRRKYSHLFPGKRGKVG